MLLKKGFIVIACSFFLLSCGTGSGTTNPKGEIQPEELNTTLVPDTNDSAGEFNNTITVQEEEIVEVNNTTEIQTEENLTVDTNSSDIEEHNYTDEELTLSAYDRYITNNSSEFSPKIVSLLFKGALPVEDGVAIIKENEKFSFKLTWQNPEYAQNINFYFFNGAQRGIQYLSKFVEDGSTSYQSSCQALTNHRFRCKGTVLDESKNYEDRISPVYSSFVMAVCDRDTRDINRICDFIRIPIVFQK